MDNEQQWKRWFQKARQDSVEDAFQEAYVKTWVRREQIKNFDSYLFVAWRNEIKNQKNEESERLRKEESLARFDSPRAWSEDHFKPVYPKELLIADYETEKIKECDAKEHGENLRKSKRDVKKRLHISDVTETSRQVFSMRERGFSYAYIAKHLSISEGYARNIISKIYKKLR